MKMIFTRSTTNLNELEKYYCAGLGFERLENNASGLFLQNKTLCPDLILHFKPVNKINITPSKEHLLIFYLNDMSRWQAYHAQLKQHLPVVAAFNPYWDKEGVTFEDPEGYGIILHQSNFSNHQARIARPSKHLMDIESFYTNEFPIKRLGDFKDHQGFDGVMLGIPSDKIHLEFTHCHHEDIDISVPDGYELTFVDESLSDTTFQDPEGYTIHCAAKLDLKKKNLNSLWNEGSSYQAQVELQPFKQFGIN